MKTVTIKRTEDNGVQTRGELFIGETYFAKTLELPWRENKKNISCIPLGNYLCKRTFSIKLLKYTYEVLNVISRDGIRLHPGNFFFDVEGCILMGSNFMDLNKDNQLDLVNSRATLQRFEDYMEKQAFILIIS